MFYKLAFQNVRKSVKDYMIYFLTLAFGVCLFYVFNSIDSQQAMLAVSESQEVILQNMSMLFGKVSIFISIVLACLILYANTFLIKRRKKELGLYLLLGACKGKISRMLLLETFMIGLLALGVGLLIGVFASQGLAVLTAQLFVVDLNQFQFTFSAEAALKSILYFGVIFIIVMIFNTITIRRHRLIDLLYANKKSEKLGIKRLWLSVVVFLISVACLGAAYYLVIDGAMIASDWKLNLAIALGVMGTFLFFLSLSGFLLRLLRTNKRFYYSGLNMFTLRQMSSRITTTFISMSIVCLMLFVSICTLSCGFSMADMLTKDVLTSCPYDATLYQKDAVQVDDIARETSNLDIYSMEEITYGDVMYQQDMDQYIDNDYLEEELKTQSVVAVPLSQYNEAMKMQGKDPLVVGENQYAVSSNFDATVACLDHFVKNNETISIGGKELEPALSHAIESTIYDQPMAMDPATIILPDAMLLGSTPIFRFVNLNYIESTGEYDQQLISRLEESGSAACTRISNAEMTAGSKTLISYLSLYIGIVFLITCAAILALQQLSESSDNGARYQMLRKLGAEKKQINRALFTQIASSFFVPLLLAVVHSAVGIYVVNDIMKSHGTNLLGSILITGGIYLIIYGSYFAVTYFGSKSVVKEHTK